MDLSLAKLVKAGTPGPDNRRIYCDDDEVFIGPDCPLIRTETDSAGRKSYKLRSRSEISHLLDAGYGFDLGLDSLMLSLNVVAKALNDGDLTLAQIAALQLGLPELADGAAVNRMAAADRLLKANFNPDEPRDPDGRWTTGASAGADPQTRATDRAQAEQTGAVRASGPVGFPAAESIVINGVRGTTVNGVTTFTGGKASTYNLPGHVTASGEPFDRHSFTAAMRKPIPLGTFAEVSYQRPGENITRSAVVRINDRGPYVSGRIIDLTPEVMRFLTGNKSDLVPVTVRLPVPPE